MNHLKWMGHSTTIFDIQKGLRQETTSCEVTLVGKGHSVLAHRFVLSSCSDLLRGLLADVPMGQEASIILPDIKGSLLDSVLAFIYMGETSLTSTNLSDFLEAINILGIKSAISFECNTATLSDSGSSMAATSASMPVKTISSIQIAHNEELMEEQQQENIAVQKIETQNVITQQQTPARELEFLDVYHEPQHKITYSIEHMPGASNANEFILTENSGTFTLTQNAKLESASNTSDSGKIDQETEDDIDDDAHIIEDYSSGADPIIEIAENSINERTNSNAVIANVSTVTSTSSAPIIELKPKIRSLKLKTVTQLQRQQQISEIDTNTGDPMSSMNTTAESFNNSTFGEGQCQDSLDLAVQAVLTEGMSLQKAAQKFDISKTVLWRRVRKHPNYMKTARENPVLALAYERLKSGESLKNISRELDIPMSTLHRHKVRLAQQGRLPDYVTFKKRDSSTKDVLKEKLVKAVHACVHEGMSQNHAANLFDIPKSTLWRHLQKRVAEAELSQNMEVDDIKQEVILS